MTLGISAGEVVGLLAPSGSGKSTLVPGGSSIKETLVEDDLRGLVGRPKKKRLTAKAMESGPAVMGGRPGDLR